MDLGFAVEHGNITRLFEDCSVVDSGKDVTYSPTVYLRANRQLRAITWTCDKGIFTPTPEVNVLDDPRTIKVGSPNHKGQTSSLALELDYPIYPGGELGVRAEIYVAHERPLGCLYRSSGPEGLEELQLGVFFAGDSLPKHIWQVEKTADGTVVYEGQLSLQSADELDNTSWHVDLSLSDVLPRLTFGFRWEW